MSATLVTKASGRFDSSTALLTTPDGHLRLGGECWLLLWLFFLSLLICSSSVVLTKSSDLTFSIIVNKILLWPAYNCSSHWRCRYLIWQRWRSNCSLIFHFFSQNLALQIQVVRLPVLFAAALLLLNLRTQPKRRQMGNETKKCQKSTQPKKNKTK